MAVIQRYVYTAGTTVLGGQDVVNLDYIKLPFQVSVVVDIVSGVANYGIEFTIDDVSGDPATFRWIADTVSLPNGQTASGIFLVNSPVTALRLNLQSFTGEVRFTVIQPIGTTI
jgi:hypothetical protein